MTRIFDIETPEDVFDILDKKFKNYCAATAKSPEDILLILMLTNLLGEWIAPKYNPKNNKWPTPRSPEQVFSKQIFEHSNFATIRHLCNGSKHATRRDLKTTIEYEENVFAWSDVHKVRDVHKGEVIGYMVDGVPVENIVEPVIAKYAEWFSSTNHP
jgi:hypothetical protein